MARDLLDELVTGVRPVADDGWGRGSRGRAAQLAEKEKVGEGDEEDSGQRVEEGRRESVGAKLLDWDVNVDDAGASYAGYRVWSPHRSICHARCAPPLPH